MTPRGQHNTSPSRASTQGLEELNLLEWSLAILARHAPTNLKTLSARDVIPDAATGTQVERSILLSAPDTLSLPTWQDQDILLALLKLTMERTRFTERRLCFSLYEVLKSLHLSDSGPYCRRVSDSLDRWSGLWIKLINAWRRGGKWHSESFHVIDRVKLNRGRDYDPDAQQVIYWDDAVVESIMAKHTKGLDWEFYLTLAPTAKRLYRFLDKRFNQTKGRRPHPWTFDLVKFCHHKIGLSRNYGVNKCKEKLQPAINELEEKGYLAPAAASDRFVKQSKGVWLVDFRKAAGTQRKKRSAPPDLVAQLTDRSVNPHKAEVLAATYDRATIDEKIRYYDAQRRSGKQLRPGFLVASIEQGYQLLPQPPGTAPPIHRADQKPSPSDRADSNTVTAVKAISILDRQQRARNEFWNSLTADERNQIEAEAFRQAGRLALDGWNRAKASGHRQIETEYREAILNGHLDRLLSPCGKAS